WPISPSWSRCRSGSRRENLTDWSILIDRLVRSTLQSLAIRTQGAGRACAAQSSGRSRMGNQPDIRPGRLPDSAYAENFSDVHPPLCRRAALVDVSRCDFCYDSPCIEACPTGIDIPSFIRKISTGTLRGAAQDILEENILGGACARVCPTEVLCQRA